MKRRTFGLLATTSLAALKFGSARAQTARDPSLLKTTLTPIGAERAGNADGSIPAWTGGYTTIPAGWVPGTFMPSPYDGEASTLTIDASNMAQYADKLSDGVKEMMTKFGFSIQVYPTHRSAAYPQWVYDNVAQNCVNATLNPGGGRLGFENAYGGFPFPIPDVNNPLDAGAQIIWNHNARWQSSARVWRDWGFAVSGGSPVLSSSSIDTYVFPYYDKSGSLASYSGMQFKLNSVNDGPPNLVGQVINVWESSNPAKYPQLAWEVLAGQGRVRKAPEISFDTPSENTDGIANYDEDFGFNGSLEEYDWKYLGKQEMYIPYHNNKLVGAPPYPVHLPHFFDPKMVRWELHRVWVVEATLHPGRRNVLARRKLYVDEDIWVAGVVDAWDANGTLYHVNLTYNILRPDLPGTIQCQNTVHDMQTGNYTSDSGPFNEIAEPSIKFMDTAPEAQFDPQNMAANSQY
jgi:hypothetical protein